MLALPPRCSALRRGFSAVPLAAMALMLGSGGPAAPQDRAGRVPDAKVMERRQQFAQATG